MGQNKEPRGSVISNPRISHSVRTGNRHQIPANTHPHASPAHLLSFLPASSLVGLQCHSLSCPVSQHTGNVLMHWLLWLGSHLRLHCVCRGLKAACMIWANLCSLSPSLLLVSRCLLLGLAPASGGWIFTLCLWTLPQEVPVSCGSCAALFDCPLPHVHTKLPRVVFSFCCWIPLCSNQRSLHCRLAALWPALVSRLCTNVSAMLRYCCQP